MNASPVPSIIVAAIVRARRRVLAQLEEAGATSVDRAVALEPKRRLERKAIAYFRRRGVILEPQPGRYFMLSEKAAAWRKSVQTRVLIALGAVTAAAAAVLAINA